MRICSGIKCSLWSHVHIGKFFRRGLRGSANGRVVAEGEWQDEQAIIPPIDGCGRVRTRASAAAAGGLAEDENHARAGLCAA